MEIFADSKMAIAGVFGGIAVLCLLYVLIVAANEVTLSYSMAFDDDAGNTEEDSIESRLQTSTGLRTTKLIQTVGTSEEALDLGDISSVGVLIIRNLDVTNYVEIKTGTGGTIVAYLHPDTNGDGKGGFMVLSRAGSGFQSPWAIANTAACKIKITIVEQ